MSTRTFLKKRGILGPAKNVYENNIMRVVRALPYQSVQDQE